MMDQVVENGNLKAGEAALKEGRWADARDFFRQALRKNSRDHAALYGIGAAYFGDNKNEDAKAAYRLALSCDPHSRPEEEKLLDPVPSFFRERLKSHRFVAKNLKRIRAAAKEMARQADPQVPRIWVYWAQGIHSAPAVVRMCVKNIIDRFGKDRVIILDDGLVPFYVDIPDYVKKKTSPTAYSDVLRVFLLARYGGIWLDATCYISDDIFALTDDADYAGIYGVGARISSWHIRAKAGGVIPTMHAAAMDLYWSKHAKATQYYMFHHIFESLCFLDSGFAKVSDAAIKFSQEKGGRFQRYMMEPYDAGKFDNMIKASHVHKLTYKFEPGAVKPDSMIAHLMRDVMSS